MVTSYLSEAREFCKRGDLPAAEQLIIRFAREKLDLDCQSAALRPDGYSLNSLNGVLTLGTPFKGETQVFFKYHQEEDESKGVAEYYNSKLLEEAQLPVDVPLAARSITGEQILLYRVRTDARFADVCRNLEHGKPAGFTFEEAVEAQRELDRAVGAKYLETLHLAPRLQPAGEALHQLFFYRLVAGESQSPQPPGGRLKSFYIDQNFAFPGLAEPLPWERLAALRWRINGRLYRDSLGTLFAAANEVMAPANLPDPCPAVVGHGDAHNANVWLERGATENRLVYFDPAFAGAHLPALLAEIKATFHNIFAHPDWLYHPDDAATQRQASVRVDGEVLDVEIDWEPTPLRRAFLASKAELVWRPLLQRLAELQPGFASSDWERYVRLALFCCPTLVMNLRAGADRHNPTTSAIGLAIAVMCGSPAVEGGGLIGDFLTEVAP